MPFYSSLFNFAGAGFALALAVATLVFAQRRSLLWTAFSVGLVLLAVDSAFAGFTLAASSVEQVVHWQKLRLYVAAFIPGTWLLVSLSYARGNYREFLRRWRAALIAAYLVPAGVTLGLSQWLFSQIQYEVVTGQFNLRLGLAGKVVNGTQLVVSVLILVNMERTLRAAVGIMRWRIKYFVLGMAVLFGTMLFTSSQVLVYSGFHGGALQISGVALVLATLLLAYSLVRTRLAESEIYPSHRVLQHSVTVMLAAAYLVCVGLLAEIVQRWGGDPSFPLKAFFLMLVLLGLGVLVLSDRAQQQIKLFVSRNFRRPVHDYRKVWSAFTERTSSLLDRTELCRAVVKQISETFDLLSVTIWVVDDHQKGLIFAGSTSLTEDKADALGLRPADVEPLLQAVRARPVPFDIDQCRETWVEPLRKLNPDHFNKGGNRVCVPLVSAGEVAGLITVSDRVSGMQLSVEDFDLLRCIGDQLASNLRNLQLTRRLMEDKELQAFQTMSAFLIHDLKNTVSTLSLMVQNITTHFGDPAFRDDCLRGLSRSVAHMNDLIRRLTLLRQELELKTTETDLNELLTSALADLSGARGVAWVKDFQELPRIQADPEQLRKVLTNLLLNAKEAVNDAGEVRVSTGQENGWVTATVSDNGCGMSPEFLRRSLFRPFQTTKKNGLGIGMFQSRAIVEAHQGRIEVESEPGKGTTFRVFLPVGAQAPAQKPASA